MNETERAIRSVINAWHIAGCLQQLHEQDMAEFVADYLIDGTPKYQREAIKCLDSLTRGVKRYGG